MARPDEQLVELVLRGSEDAFRDLVRRYQRPIYALILRMVRDPAEAEELAQDVFIKAYRALDRFDRSKKFSSWLFKIAHNTAIDRLRRKRPITVPLETPEDQADPLTLIADRHAESPSIAVERGELAQAFEVALGRLRSAYREVMVLRFQEGMAYEEIAEVTGLPLGTVKTHLHRARRAMAQELTRMGFGPEKKPDESERNR